MDTRSKKDDNKTDNEDLPPVLAVINDDVQDMGNKTANKETTQEKQQKEEITLRDARHLYSKKLAGAKGFAAARVVMFILSILLVGYIATAVLIIRSSIVRWNVTDLFNYSTDTLAAEKSEYISKTNTEGIYELLCLSGSGFLRYDEEEMTSTYLSTLADELSMLGDDGTSAEITHRGLYRLSITSDDCYFYAAFGDKFITNIEGVNSTQTYASLEDTLRKTGETYYIRSGGSIYYGEGEDGITKEYSLEHISYSTDPVLNYGSSYYDKDTGIHTFFYNMKHTVMDTYTDDSQIDYMDNGEKLYYDPVYDDWQYAKTIEADNDKPLLIGFCLKENANADALALASAQIKGTRFMTISGGICAIVLILIVIILLIYSGYSRGLGRFAADTVIERAVPLEVFVCLAFLALGLAGNMFYEFGDRFGNEISADNAGIYAAAAGTYGGLWLLGFGSVLFTVRLLKAGCLLRNSIIARLIRFCFRLIKKGIGFIKARYLDFAEDNLNVANRVALRTIIFAALTALYLLFLAFVFIGDTIGDTEEALAFSTFIYLAYFGWFTFTNIKYYTDAARLNDKIYSISENKPYESGEMDETSPFYSSFRRIDDIDAIARKNAEEMIKSEKTKVELVTNVSHDLKTPLTSIISYIYLLKKEDMSDAAKDYVTVLENKSEKLKSIVNDVFTLAKAASGAEVKKERLDLTMLVNQTIASSQDMIEKSGRQVRTNIPEKAVIITGDGDKLSRVLQNLLDNALKYSLEGTRIYVDMHTLNGRAKVVFTNVSRDEMNFTADEITERFARGDKSRTDGGSGLGLSIAKTFTEACGGSFKVELEGDVFKAIVSFEENDK